LKRKRNIDSADSVRGAHWLVWHVAGIGLESCCMSYKRKSDNASQLNEDRVFWVLPPGFGHQTAYEMVLKPTLGEAGVRFVDTKMPLIKTNFFPTLDFDYPALLKSSFWSAFGGRKTVALLLRPQTCVRPTKPIHRIKQILFKLLRQVPNVSILVIVPFSVEPKLAIYADDWINDPQLWDLAILAPQVLQTHHNAQHSKLKKITILGRLDREKGFEQFASLWIDNQAVRQAYQFVAAGVLDPSLAKLGARFSDAGGVLINERISDEHMFALYHESYAMWCAYDREYDQASGIFGRAFQLGVPTIITEGSMLHRHAEALCQHHLALSPDWLNNSTETARRILEWKPSRVTPSDRESIVSNMRNRDIDRLATYLLGKVPA